MNKKKKIILISSIIILILIIIAAICLCLLNKKDKTYTVSFNINDDTSLEPIIAKENEEITLPKDLEMDGFIFNGWFLNDELVSSPYKVTSDVTLVAGWISVDSTAFEISINPNNGNEIIPILVAEGDKLSKPEEPKKENFKFVGWYLNDTEYDFNQEVKESFTIIAKWKEDKKDENKTEEVKGNDVSVEGISLNKTSLSLNKGNTETISATVSPNNASNKNITWTSSNTTVATVDGNGKITGTGKGNTTITATSSNGKTATCAVTVSVPVESIKITSSSTHNHINYNGTVKSITLTATITPSDAADTVEWSVPNEGGQSGALTATRNGNTITITARSGGAEGNMNIIAKAGGKEASYTIYKEPQLSISASGSTSVAYNQSLVINSNQSVTNWDVGSLSSNGLITINTKGNTSMKFTNTNQRTHQEGGIIKATTAAGQTAQITVNLTAKSN